MDVLRGMSLFVRIVDKGSITQAAQASDLTATMVGNHLRALEDHLGMKLLNRTTRQQQLTDFGATYYQRCVDILGMVEDAQMDARTARREPQGKLRVSFPHAFGYPSLAASLGRYMLQYPKVDLEISFTDRYVDLLEEGYEAAVRIGHLPDSSLIARPLRPHTLVLCAAPAYLNGRGVPEHPSDLAQHDCLAYLYSGDRAQRRSSALWHLDGPDGSHEVDIRPRLRMDSGPALSHAALSGLGIVLLPLAVVDDCLRAGTLVQLLPEYGLPQRPLHLLYLKDPKGSTKLRSFIEFMIETFGVGDA